MKYDSILDKALIRLVEIDLLDLYDDARERSIEDLDSRDSPNSTEIAIILYTLIRAYEGYRGDITTYLEDLEYTYSIEAIPLANPYTREVSKDRNRVVDKAITLYLELEIGRKIDRKVGIPRATIDELYPNIEEDVRGYLSIVANGNLENLEDLTPIEDYLDLIRYTYKIEVYPNPRRPD